MKPFILTLAFLSVFFGYSQTENNKLSLLFIGDFMGHKAQINAAYHKESKTYNYESCFQHISKSLSETDITIGNLEVVLGIQPFSGYPRFSSPESYATAIRNAGVDILVTANNHSCDKGKRGLEKTIHVLDSLNIKHTGTFISAEAKEKESPLIINKNGFKIAILNYTYGTNWIKPTPPNVVNYLKETVIKKDIEKARALNVDEIIAFVHWGKEYKNLPDTYQKKWNNFLKKQGVNIVVGAHPHVVQPMKLDKEKGTFIAYSLGNFVSHQRTFPRDGGAVLKLELVKENGKVIVDNAQYKLTWVYAPIENGRKKYYVLPVSEFENYPEFFTRKKDYDKMMRFTKHARKLLGKENKNVTEYK